MLYRTMEKTGDSLSILGYGTMRLPMKGNVIDEETTTRQIRYAIDNGVNYIDTAVPYQMGASEPFLGRALAGGYREKVKLATKLPVWHVKNAADMERLLKLQLDNLKTDHIDYYLFHNLREGMWNKLLKLGAEDFIKRMKAEGKVINIGFSYHGPADEFKRVVDAYDWDFCQIQYNILDRQNQAGTEGLKYAAEKGMGIVIMEPLRGGNLSRNVPAEVQAIWDEASIKRSPSEWALRWVWDHPEVTVVLSGMNDDAHVKENIRIAGEALPDSLTDEELNFINRAETAYRRLFKVGCTGCAYCMPCPSGVDIPACFQTYNTKYLSGKANNGKIDYIVGVGGAFNKKKPGYASMCKECGKCVKACPQHIDIPKHLKEVKKEFEGPDAKIMAFGLKQFIKLDGWRTRRKAQKGK